MTFRLQSTFFRRAALLSPTLVVLVVVHLSSQNADTSLTLLSRDGRRALATTPISNQVFVALDDLAAAFQLTVREEAGAITVSYKGKTIVLTPDQPLASVSGRLVSLAAAPTRVGGRWMVTLDFINRALPLVYDANLDLRRASRLLVIGDLRVPRVTVREEPLGNASRLTIDATPRAQSTVAQEGQRLTVTFEADALDAALPTVGPDGLVDAIRATGPAAIAIDLGPRFGTFRATSETIDTTSRLVVDVMTAQTEASPSPPPPAVAVEPPALAQPTTPIRSIAVDAGHGGLDLGVKGPGGTVEKDLTLAVARRLKAAVEGRLGIRVVLTRDEDRALSVDDRTAIANNNKADFLVSLHANASFRAASSGAAIYLASFESADPIETPLTPERVPTFGGGLRDIELVPWNLAQVKYAEQSSQAAEILRQRLQDHVPLAQQPIVHAPLRLLESANMPALLVEMGYLTNPEQETLLSGADFQSAVVQALYDTIVRFRDALAAEAGR